ncbi:porin, partial [Aquisalimonas lutea]|uniref:porin n=1 Tax=Aquisalimonas lutea TaxID=1327750 RepID=UPI0025B4F6D8
VGVDERTAELDAGGKDTSYVGVGARHGLSEDVAAVAALELFYRPDDADYGRFPGDDFFARNANVGLESPYGTLRGGRVTAPLYLPMVFTNAFGGSFVFSPANFHTYAGAGRSSLVGDSGWSDSVMYTAPGAGGVTANVVYGFGEQQGASGENRVGANAVYRAGALVVAAAGHMVDLSTTGFYQDAAAPADPGTQYAGLLGASYDFGVLTAYAQYQYIDNDVDAAAEGDAFSSNTATVGVSVPAGPGSVLASYAYSDASLSTGSASGGGHSVLVEAGARRSWAVGYEVALDEQATVYATYFSDD